MSLGLRVKRLYTDAAWAEDPPSLTRRMVSNIRVGPGRGDGELPAKSGLLLGGSSSGSNVYAYRCRIRNPER